MNGQDVRYADCNYVACPRCGVAVGKECVNPINHLVARAPCVERYKAAASTDPRAGA